MRLSIHHTTSYDYDREVVFHPHILYLRPRENPLLDIKSFELELTPSAQLRWMRDDFDNLPATATFTEPGSRLEVVARCQVDIPDSSPFDFEVRDYALDFPFVYEPLHRSNLSLYLTPPKEATQEELRAWLKQTVPIAPTDTVGWLFILAGALQRGLRYQVRHEEGIQSAAQTLTLQAGSCRDFAALFVACARTYGVAARFVSGYMFDPQQGSAPGHMHAWVEVFLPGAGWRGLDPTHGIFCDNRYVPVAHAVVAESVNPIQGSFFSTTPAQVQLKTTVQLRQA